MIKEECQNKLSLLIPHSKKILEKQRKTTEDQGIKQAEALKILRPEEALKTLKQQKNQELEPIEGLYFLKNMATILAKLKKGKKN